MSKTSCSVYPCSGQCPLFVVFTSLDIFVCLSLPRDHDLAVPHLTYSFDLAQVPFTSSVQDILQLGDGKTLLVALKGTNYLRLLDLSGGIQV